MSSTIFKLGFFLSFILSSTSLFAQSNSGSSLLSATIVGIVVLIIIGAVWVVSSNLFRIEASKLGVADDFESKPSFLTGSSSKETGIKTTDLPVRTLKKGFDINLAGNVVDETISSVAVKNYAVSPVNFKGISPIPKVVVEEGSKVLAGDVLFFDKKNPDVKYVSPVSGEVTGIVRGAKRSIHSVTIAADGENQFKELEAIDVETSSRESLINFLAESGVWPLIKQRPFNLIADTQVVPRDIFISTFSTAPLALDNEIAIEGQEASFQQGIDVLAKLTSGSVHLGLNGNKEVQSSFEQFNNTRKYYFKGAHPAGNVGVQIHHIAPIIGGEDIVWTLGVQDVITLGKLFTAKKYDVTRIVSLVGTPLDNPQNVSTKAGANIGELLATQNVDDNSRIISGDIFTGEKKENDQFLNAFDSQITVIEEGNEFEMFGWLLPLTERPSISRSLPGFLFPDIKYKANTNTHGEKRAFVVTGQYESVLPMDIFPQHLMKSIIINDYEAIEGLGIYELEKEDIAICEFVCTSKQPLQQILERGHDMMIAEG